MSVFRFRFRRSKDSKSKQLKFHSLLDLARLVFVLEAERLVLDDLRVVRSGVGNEGKIE